MGKNLSTQADEIKQRIRTLGGGAGDDLDFENPMSTQSRVLVNRNNEKVLDLSEAEGPEDVAQLIVGKVYYASKSGCALDADIDVGGGTDDTAALQAILDKISESGGGTLVLDGYALISNRLIIGSNTTISAYGGGVFMAADSPSHILTTALARNTGTVVAATALVAGRRYRIASVGNTNWGSVGAALIPASATAGSDIPAGTQYNTFVASGAGTGTGTALDLDTRFTTRNITVLGGIWNGNSAGQSSRYENNIFEYPNGWKMGFWLAWVQGVVLRDVTVRNSKTFSIVLGAAAKDVAIDNCRSIWDDGGADVTPGQNHDGIHLWGSVSNLKVNGYFANGDDDVIALNTDENMTRNLHANPDDPNSAIGEGLIENVVFENVCFDSSNGIRFIGTSAAKPEARVNNVMFKNITGQIFYLAMPMEDLNVGDLAWDGWYVKGSYNNLYINRGERLTLNNIGSTAQSNAAINLGNFFNPPPANHVYVPSSGDFTYSIPNPGDISIHLDQNLLIASSGQLGGVTINLPLYSKVADGSICRISAKNGIDTLTIGTAGGALLGYSAVAYTAYTPLAFRKTDFYTWVRC